MKVETLSKTLNRRYWLFSAGFVLFGLGTAAAIGMYNTALGVACLLAELTYFSYVNMVTVGEIRERLNAAKQYTAKLAAQAAADPRAEHEKEITGGQYL